MAILFYLLLKEGLSFKPLTPSWTVRLKPLFVVVVKASVCINLFNFIFKIWQNQNELFNKVLLFQFSCIICAIAKMSIQRIEMVR